MVNILKEMRETTIKLIDIYKSMPYYLFDDEGNISWFNACLVIDKIR